MLEIVTAPHSALSTKAKEVTNIDAKIQKLLLDMEEALNLAKDPIGVGLAAPQVGVGLRIFIARPNPKAKLMIFINPEIKEAKNDPTKKKPKKNDPKKLEGCLSLLHIWGIVKRKDRVKVSYLDEKGNKKTKEFKGFVATIIQHEIDHLDGILFPKRVLEQKGKLYKSEKDEDGDDVFEEIPL